MREERRRACGGLSSGLFHSPSFLLAQFNAAIGFTVGASRADLALALALLQTRAGARSDEEHRRHAVVGLGGNLGAVLGAGLGPVAALGAKAAWLARPRRSSTSSNG